MTVGPTMMPVKVTAIPAEKQQSAESGATEIRRRSRLLPKKCFCFSLRSGTISQGVLCLVTACINIALVLTGIGDLMEAKLNDFCWPDAECFDKLRKLEHTLALTIVVLNAMMYVSSTLLLVGIKKEKSSYMTPFMFIQGLVISGLAGAGLTALVIFFRTGSWIECTVITAVSSVYLTIHIYLALVVRAYYVELRDLKVIKEPVLEVENGTKMKKKRENVEYREMTIEDYVF